MPTRALLVFVAALALGLGGGTLAARSVGASHAAPAPAEPHAPAARPAATPAARRLLPMPTRDSSPGEVAAADTLRRAAADAAAPVAAPAAAPAAVPVAVPVAAPVAPALTTEQQAARARVARMFGTMPPRDAARVLAQMPDEEVLGILGGLRERQVAAILAQLDARRAAALGRGLLHDGGAR